MTVESINFDQAADYYDRTRGFPPDQEAPIAAFIAEQAGLKRTDRLLEIGIGTGRIALPLASYVGEIVGVDISRAMMERLRAKQTDQRVLLVEGDAEKLPLASSLFDAVIVVHVFHLVSDLTAVLDELARALKPGGRLIRCWGGGTGSAALHGLREAWKSGVGHEQPWDQVRGAQDAGLIERGWTTVSEELSYAYPASMTPREVIDQFRARLWSATWKLTDDEIERGAAAMEALAREHFTDLDATVQTSATFNLRSFVPPVP